MFKRLSLSTVLALSLLAQPASADAKFEAYIQGLWPWMQSKGFSRQLFDAAFDGITEPDKLVLAQASKQPEFTSTTSEYLVKAVTQIRIDSGQAKKKENAQLLNDIQAKYGVDKHVVLGIWGMESNFGKDLGSMRVMRSLATLMYAGRKKDFAREQMIAAMTMLKKGDRQPDDFKGSWAAAMGHTQFIPASYLSFAVDWNDDGNRDIWGHYPDALASTANYLAKAGWKADRPWGWEVRLPSGFDRGLIGRRNWKPMSEWAKLGITPATASKFNAPANARAFVMIPQGMNGPAFLITDNFLAIMKYNVSHSYALAVGHLGDRIRGGAGIEAAWPEVNIDLSLQERLEMQKRLNAGGFDTGLVDGRFGAKVYEAIIAYQRKAGLEMDGKPTRKLLERMRKSG